ncbi:MAG: ABC transporter permease [Acidimicrobiia bacterium]|nr:ABC transporter permease [Acidimicrobiia bacterium]
MAPRTPPPPGRAVRLIFDLSLGRMLWSSRSLFTALLAAAPLVLALAGRVLSTGGVAFAGSSGPADGLTSFGVLIMLVYARFVVPVAAVVLGTSIMADEVEGRTLTYLFARPVPRWAVLAGKYLAYLVCTALLVLPTVTVLYFALVPLASVGATFGLLLADLLALALGIAVYGAVFALAGARLRRPVVFGFLFVFGWEQVALLLPGTVNRVTVAGYLEALIPHDPPGSSGLFGLGQLVGDKPGVPEAVLCLLVVHAVCLWLATLAVARREYVE